MQKPPPQGGGQYRTPYTIKGIPMSPGGESGRGFSKRFSPFKKRDYPILKGNQTRFRKKNEHSRKREGGEVAKTEDQS